MIHQTRFYVMILSVLHGAQWDFFYGLCCALLSGYRYAAPPGGADARAGANALATTAIQRAETGSFTAPRLL